MSRSQPELDRLLSDCRRLSVTEKEEILERVLDATAQPAPRAWGALRWALVASPVVLLLVPAFWFSSRSVDAEFTARGGSFVAPTFHALCLDESGGESPCRAGHRLVFRTAAAPPFNAFAAFALSPAGETLWYFPGSGHPTSVPIAAGEGVIDTAIAIDASHPPGRYEVFGVFSEVPLTKEAIRQAVLHPAEAKARIVKRQLEVGSP